MNENKDISKEIQDELEGISQNLANISRELPFKVPTGYFETLSENASEMALETDVQRVSIIRRLLTVRNIAVAASVIIIAMLVWMQGFNVPEEEVYVEVSIDEMIEYLDEEGAYGFDEEALIEELIEVEALAIAEEASMEDSTMDLNEDITDEDIIEYLLEENVDLATIIEVLN